MSKKKIIDIVAISDIHIAISNIHIAINNSQYTRSTGSTHTLL